MTAKRMHKPTRRASRRAAPKRVYHPGPPTIDEAALNLGVEGLRAKHPEFVGRLIEIGGLPPLRRREPGFGGLAAIIVSQQVSTASANAIFARLEARIVPLEAAELAKASDDGLRACGLSAPKIRGLRSLAAAVVEGLDLAGLSELDAEEAHNALIAVKGIGPWTADIFLLFCLAHPDAFPAGDLALQEAARLALDLKRRPDAARLERIAERWRPWRGIAARLLWSYYRGVKTRSGMALADASR
jgi:DNA-3-methyladenine glycosylase II